MRALVDRFLSELASYIVDVDVSPVDVWNGHYLLVSWSHCNAESDNNLDGHALGTHSRWHIHSSPNAASKCDTNRLSSTSSVQQGLRAVYRIS